MRTDDPSDNAGRGWRRLTSEEVAALAYLAIRLASSEGFGVTWRKKRREVG